MTPTVTEQRAPSAHSSACYVFMRTNEIVPQLHRRGPVSNGLVLGSGDTTSHSVKIFCCCVRKLQKWGGAEDQESRYRQAMCSPKALHRV